MVLAQLRILLLCNGARGRGGGAVPMIVSALVIVLPDTAEVFFGFHFN